VVFREAAPEVDKADFAAIDHEALALLVDLRFDKEFFVCFAYGVDAKTMLEHHLDGLLITHVALVWICNEKDPHVARWVKVKRLLV
jgi:hypothetical protein